MLCLTLSLLPFSSFSQIPTCAPQNSKCSSWFFIDLNIPFSQVSSTIPNDCFVGVPGSVYVEKKIGNQYLNVIIYPNPATDLVNLFFKNQFKGSVKLVNAEGKELFSTLVVEFNDLQVNTSDLGSGIYFLQFIDENKNTVTEKVNIVK